MNGSDTGDGQNVEHRVDDSEGNSTRYLFPVDGDHCNAILRIVCDLVADDQADLFIGMPVIVPEQTPPNAPQPAADGARRASKYLMRARDRCTGAKEIDKIVCVGHGREAVLQEMVESYSIDTLVIEDQPESGMGSLLAAQGFDAAIPDGCDTVVVSRIDLPKSIESIIVPIAAGPHSGMAIEVGRALALGNQATLELFHVYESGDDEAREEGLTLLQEGMDRVSDVEEAEQTLLAADAVSETIIEYTDSFDVSVLGAPREGLLGQFVAGTVPERVRSETDGTVLITHRGGTDESWLNRLL